MQGDLHVDVIGHLDEGNLELNVGPLPLFVILLLIEVGQVEGGEFFSQERPGPSRVRQKESSLKIKLSSYS